MDNMSESGISRSMRVMLWTSHRCLSTVFTRSMGQIPGMEIWFEPYGYAYNAMLNVQLNDGIDLPTSYEGNEAIYIKASQYIGRMMSRTFQPEGLSYEKLKKMLESSTAEMVFVKDIGLAMQRDDLRELIPKGYRHSFLIRHPLLMFSSLRKANYQHLKGNNILHEGETCEAEFDMRRHIEMNNPFDYYRSLYDLWKYIKETIDPEPVILDASDLQRNPSAVLPLYCKAVGLPFTNNMLGWENAPLDDIQSWNTTCNINVQTGFFEGVLSTTRFSPPKDLPSRDELTPDVIELADEALPFYEEMYKNRLH
ncbi:branched-chain-amino-acid aminotransferase-like protein 2 [Lytechinus variegatus]|uniref:branched-chain-amino-acid aminotransferase-like protein 2 n=1 Tax=Lytechinus variegatus TaxID=7654 RepID=UPI001BB0F8E7|nr:branched-chain-amino-acid aminotransferase-like protein 2 [Lytechinus variegatus]